MLPNKNSYDQLGGELQDYSTAVDPTTDLPAEASNELRSDVAGMTRTVIKAWFGFTVTGSSVVIANTDYDAVYGNANAYKPVGVRNIDGEFTFTLPAEIVDARGITQALNLQCGFGNAEREGAQVSITKLTPNTIYVKVFDAVNGNLIDPTTFKAFVFVI